MRRRHGMQPTRERGRPARTTPARPRPTPPPGSTGNGAGAPLRPGPCGSRRQGGRVPHRGETERHATVVHAGGTPALPGGHPPVTLGGRSPSFVDNFHPPPSTLHPSNPGGRLFQSLLLLEGAHAGLTRNRQFLYSVVAIARPQANHGRGDVGWKRSKGERRWRSG